MKRALRVFCSLFTKKICASSKQDKYFKKNGYNHIWSLEAKKKKKSNVPT